MSARTVFNCAQDSKGPQVLARARKDCASIFWTVLSLSLSSQQWWAGSVGSETCQSFLFKGTWIWEELCSHNIPLSYAWLPIHAFLEILPRFFKACKTVSSPHSAGVSRKNLPPSHQLRWKQTNKTSSKQNKIIHILLYPFQSLTSWCN